MAVGDIVSVGDCLLIAESYEPKQALSKKYDALEQLNYLLLLKRNVHISYC